MCLSEFSPAWWGWLLATGTFMACTWSSKVNGILTVATIGVAVLIDLWDILDYKKGHSMVRPLAAFSWSWLFIAHGASRNISGSISQHAQSV